MKIQNNTINKGAYEHLCLEIAELPSGTIINADIHIYRALEEGPCILLTAGIHGDEINGIEMLREMIELNVFGQLLKGTVIVIPLVNAFGFINFSRDVPDGKDVNRSFPGSTKGSLASKIAHLISKDILPHADIIMDFHTGGAARYNYPQFRITKDDKQALDIAKESGIELILTKPTIAKSFRALCHKLNKPVLVFEGGESIRYDINSILMGKKTIKNTLKNLGMMGGTNKLGPHLKIFTKTHWIRSQNAGLFMWSTPSGNEVKKGDVLGVISTLKGKKTKVKSPRDGYLVGHNNAAVVNHGDPLFNIGFNPNDV